MTNTDQKHTHELEHLLQDLLLQHIHFDSAHDLAHIQRVVKQAKLIAQQEGANLRIVVIAAWLHDIVNVPKNSPDRSKASRLAAQKAKDLLIATENIPVSTSELDSICHAIESHSFSAQITPTTLEAKVVQDADRLDSLGAIGVSRCLLVSGQLNRQLYNLEDPFCENRPPADDIYSLDHFYSKLFTLADSLNTATAKKIAKEREGFMKEYIKQLCSEIM